MFAGNWFGKRLRLSQRGQALPRLKKGLRRKDAARRRDRALRMEELEERRLLATFVVNNTGDLDTDGNVITGTLRQAIGLSNASDEDDTIVFADFLFKDAVTGLPTPQTISLDGRAQGGQLNITDAVEILGPGADALRIQGGGSNDRIFDINIGPNDEFFSVTIGGMTLSNGSLTGTANDNQGGAIFNRENLTLIETVFSSNSASRGGGAVYNERGTLIVERSLFGPSEFGDTAFGPGIPLSGNSSSGGGGAILNGADGQGNRGTVIFSNSTLANNFTSGAPMLPGYGGGIFNRNGNVTVQHSTISGNS
ncbi:MAG: hypothetical protein MI725_15460, partial [Pirellulales bacterium]|nr:hypothetical protein [Pirellulales bacterium]